MKNPGSNLWIMIIWVVLGISCSQTKRLTEGEVLYTGVKKMNIETAHGVKLEGPAGSAISDPLNFPPNNPLYSPYFRSPLPIGLWVYNWNIKKERGVKYWLYKKLAKKPVLISDVQPELRLKVLENAAAEYGYFDVKSNYEIIPNKRNPKKAKISYNVYIPNAYKLGRVEFWGWTGRMDSLIRRTQQGCLLKSGAEYNLYSMEEERSRITRLLRNGGYYYFQANYIEFLVDTTRGERTADVRIALKHGIPAVALHPYKVGKVELVLENADQAETLDTLSYKGIEVKYTKPLDVKTKVLARSLHLLPGDVYSLRRQNRTQSSLARLGIFKYTNLNVTRADSINNDTFGSLNFGIHAVYDLPIETEFEVDISSKSNNLLGPGLSLGVTNRNLFRGGENLTFKLNGAYEWEMGDKQSNSNSGLINSYELGINVGLSLPRLLVPAFLKNEKDYAERTNFQVGVDFLNRHTFFRMVSFSGSLSYDFQSSWRVYHSVTPLKITYTHLLQTSKEFDETMENNPAIAMSFKNQLIPSMSYSYTYDRVATKRNPNRLYWQNVIMSAGNVLAAVQAITGNHQGKDKKLFGNIYSQFLKLTSEIITYRKITETSLLAMRFMGGIGYAYGNSEVIPYSEQFYIGGANSIRAFTIRSIGPGSYHQESDNKTAYLDQTGDVKLEGNLELRFKIMYQLNGALFLDAGNVWLLRNDPKRPGGEFKIPGLLSEIALGTGFGVRYDLGFIVIRGDLGIALHTPYKNLNRHGYYNIPSFKEGLKFHLAIGYPF